MASAHPVAVGSLVAARYEIQNEIARGGMGIVYRVLDRTNGQTLALKRSRAGLDAIHKERLRREYQTLVTLRHPHIIQVYDFGVDEVGPYYTMDLLDGADLRKLSPLPWRTVCSYLRDVASSLALLHCRRLLHGDVWAANVRVTSQGRAKLIDFGTLTSFGRNSLVAGTPPATPPEVLDGLDLDQRVDLYGLGATAYFALTGRHAYPVSTMALLHAIWDRGAPPPPSTLVADVPRELDDLVMSLIELNRSSRPHTAAQVIDRLDAIAGLLPDHDERIARSYVLGTGLVGREQERKVALAQLSAALAGQGGGIVITGERGLGKTALLEDVLSEAKIQGAQIVFIKTPTEARPQLLWSLLVGALCELKVALDAPPSGRGAAVMAGVFVRVQPLVIAIDDLDQADPPSLLACVELVRATRGRPVFFLGTAALEAAAANDGLRELCSALPALALTPFDARATHAFVERLFGAVAAAPLLSAYLRDRAGGNPQTHAEIIGRLIDHGAIRYLEGEWVLPHDLSASNSQVDVLLDEAFDRRFVGWSPALKALALCLSPHRRAFDLELCRVLVRHEPVLADAPLEPLLLELVDEGLLTADSQGYAFARPRLREHVYAQLDAATKRRQHLTLATALEQRDTASEKGFEIGFHFFLAGDEAKARRHINKNLHTSLVDPDKLVGSIDDLTTLLNAQRSHGIKDEDLALNEGVLVVSGYYVDPTVHDRLGTRALSHLHEISGFARARRLQKWLGANLALLCGVLWAWLARLTRKPTLFGGTFLDALLTFVGACSSMSAVACFRLDRKTHPQLLRFLAVARALPRHNGLRLVYDLVHVAGLIVRGRFAEAHAGLEDQLVRLKKVPFFHEEARRHYEAGLQFFIGRSLLLRGEDGALYAAQRMEALGAKQDLVMAQFLRRTHFLYRGNHEAVKREERRLDALSAQHGTRWIADMLRVLELLPYHLAGDVLGLKQTMHRMEGLLTIAPGLGTHRRVIEAMYEGHRGRPGAALDLYRALASELEPFCDPVWAAARAHQAECLNTLGRHAEALDVCEGALGQLSEADRVNVFAYQQLDREAAIALAGLSRGAEAATRLDALLAGCSADLSPLLRGLLHFDRARVAATLGDASGFDRHAQAARAIFTKLGNPALLARVRRLATLAVTVRAAQNTTPAASTDADLEQVLGAEVRQRAEELFSRIVETCKPRSAELHVVVFGNAVSCARVGDAAPSLHTQVVSIARGEAGEPREPVPAGVVMLPLKSPLPEAQEVVGVLTLSGCAQREVALASPLLAELARELSEVDGVTVLG